MPERIKQFLGKWVEWIKKTTLKQRIIGLTALLTLLGLILLLSFTLSRPHYVQLYDRLSEKETGEITARLKEMGVPYQLTPTGTGILVPQERAADVRVQLAAEGIPKSGSITYESFAQNMNLGMTDRQFSVVERDAMQNELRNMIIQGIKGIRDVQVMLTLPEDKIWVSQEEGKATASLILDVDPGVTLSQSQINAIYTLVSRGVPNLPIENIIITDQYGEALEPNFTNPDQTIGTNDFEKLQSIKKSVERDIETSLKNLLTPIMGQGQVTVQAFATMDFTKEQRQENLVTAPDTVNNSGLVISMEKLNETWNYQGNQGAGGIPGPANTDIPGYQAGTTTNGNGNYEKDDQKINYEVNRITRSVTASPYRIADLSINVGANLPTPNPNDPNAVQAYNDLKNSIQQVVANVVRTALGQAGRAFTDAEINQRVTVIAMPFQQPKSPVTSTPSLFTNPSFYMIIGGVLLLAAVIIYVLARRRKKEETLAEELEPVKLEEVPPISVEETEESIIRKQLERLARENPKDFVTLLRSWIAEDR